MSVFDRIVITGAKGMLAHDLKRALDARGLNYFGTDLDTFDLTKPDDVQKLFAQQRPTVVFNCAAYTNVDGSETNEALANSVNGDAVGNLAEAAKEFGTKIVHISTDFVFDGTSTRPYLPTDRPNPQSAYARSKLLGETKLAEANPHGWLIARTAWLYGVGGNCFPKTILNVARQGKPLRVVADQIGSPTHAADVADALVELVARDARGIFHVVNAGVTSWHGFTAAILEEFGVKAELSQQTTAEYRKLKPASALRPAYSVLNISATEQTLGRAMRPWREALKSFRSLSEIK